MLRSLSIRISFWHSAHILSSYFLTLCYDENVVFLRFCFEKELLKKNPLDRQGRILRMVYLNQDLTNIGKNLFPKLLDKFLAFFDRKGKTSLETMLQRWYIALEKEYRSQTAE